MSLKNCKRFRNCKALRECLKTFEEHVRIRMGILEIVKGIEFEKL